MSSDRGGENPFVEIVLVEYFELLIGGNSGHATSVEVCGVSTRGGESVGRSWRRAQQ